jgi:alpha-galactosidase
MTETIRRMVEDYGADYIKFDYNQDIGIGVDGGLSSGEGLERCTAAFFRWVDAMKRRFPDVIFEGCASGGMRMDYKTLSHFSLVSTSDQVDYLKYPCIAANILSAVLPEQAAVWSYPVGTCIKDQINDRQIIMNMVNSFLGRMHLASHLEWMNAHQLALVREGVAYYKTLSGIRHTALPFFPMGFTGFGAETMAAGLKDGNRVWLAVWCLKGETAVEIDMGAGISAVRLAYPSAANATYTADGHKLRVVFDAPGSAAFFEATLG